jgi:hypothetical protein
VRAPGADGGIRFQHQLFQEWYAAADVEDLMLQAAAGNIEARKRLREEVLNWSSWEESILFACDRLSRTDHDGIRAVAAAIDDALCIDTLLAAAMLHRAADAVWEHLRARVVRFVHRWHTPGKIDRAARFMVTSGKPEFADLFWPLASNTDDQIQIQAFRVADRFRHGVLGHDGEARLCSLPASKREIALSEIACASGFDGMELVAKLASTDQDPKVVLAVVEALAFRRGDRHVNTIMQTASDAAWAALGRQDYPEHLTDGALDARLAKEREATRAVETRPVLLLERTVNERPTDAAARITALLTTADEEFKDMHFEHAIVRAHAEYPAAVAEGLVARIAAGVPLPYGVGDYLKETPVLDSGPVAEAALNPATHAGGLRSFAFSMSFASSCAVAFASASERVDAK